MFSYLLSGHFQPDITWQTHKQKHCMIHLQVCKKPFSKYLPEFLGIMLPNFTTVPWNYGPSYDEIKNAKNMKILNINHFSYFVLLWVDSIIERKGYKLNTNKHSNWRRWDCKDITPRLNSNCFPLNMKDEVQPVVLINFTCWPWWMKEKR